LHCFYFALRVLFARATQARHAGSHASAESVAVTNTHKGTGHAGNVDA
jgi:hypothetical protein